MKMTVFYAMLTLAFLSTVFLDENMSVIDVDKKMDYEKFVEQTMALRDLWIEFQDIPLPQYKRTEEILEQWRKNFPDIPHPGFAIPRQTDEQRMEYIQRRRNFREKCRSFTQSEKYHYNNGILDFIWGQCRYDAPYPHYRTFMNYLPYSNPPMELESFCMMFPYHNDGRGNCGLLVRSITLDLIPIAGNVSRPSIGTRALQLGLLIPGKDNQHEFGGTPPTGDALKRLGYYEEAYSAYLETAYFELNDIRTSLINTAPLWLEVAECNYRLGKKDLAWSYLMKVGVFGSAQHLEQVKETAKFWIQCEEEGVGLPKPEKLTKEERQEIAQGIVNGYMRFNGHPRAWAFIEQYPENFDDPIMAKKEVQGAWLAVVNPLLNSAISYGFGGREFVYKGETYSDPGASVIVFNQRLYPDGIDPLDVKIPWAFSGDSVDRARAMLRKAMQTVLLEDEPRTWRTIDGEYEQVASFVSSNATHVTLKQADDEIATFELSALSPDDQEYVRLRLDAEKGTGMFAPSPPDSDLEVSKENDTP